MFTDIKKLIAFAAVVDEGSFIGAADRLHTSQPWLSIQIRQLEDMLNLTLLERSRGKRVAPTAEGRALYAIARRAMDYCADISQEIKALRADEAGTLAIGVEPTSIYVASRNDLIFRFISAFGNVKTTIEAASPPELMQGLLRKEFDLIITTTPEPDQQIELLPICEAELSLIAPKGSVRVDANGAADIDGLDIITFPVAYDPQMVTWLHSKLEPAGARFIECPEKNFEALLRYADELGLPTISTDFSDQILAMRDRMDVLPIKDFALTIEWSLVRRKGFRSRAADSFWDIASRAPKGMIQSH